MPTEARMKKIAMVTAVAALTFHGSIARSEPAQAAAAAAQAPKTADTHDVHAVLNAAAARLGMPRTPGVRKGSLRLDAVNTFEFWASGSPFSEYHVGLAYKSPGYERRID
jgi:hypothetical protein